jgi:hypothetical protein
MITYERPISAAARWARRIARLAFGLFVVAILAHRFGSLSTTTFVTLAGLSAAMALLALVLAAVGFVRLWQVAAVGGIAGFIAVLYAAVPLAAVGLALAQVALRPGISEVSTDLATPPPFIRAPAVETGWLAPRPAMVADRQAQARAYPALSGRRYDGALDRVLAGVRAVAEQSGIAIVAEEGLENAEPDFEDLALRPEAAAPAAPAGSANGAATARGGRKGADSGSVLSGSGQSGSGLSGFGPRPGAVPVPMSRPLPNATPLPAGRRIGDILLQGESRSPIVGFRFDIVIRLREELETTLVDIRVASRTGRHDLGLDAATAERFLHALDAELLGIAGD